MGSLRKYMPTITMLIGTLAIAGIPPLSGFFSKANPAAGVRAPSRWFFAVITAMMTAFYMWRLMAMTFFGTYRGRREVAGHGHGEATRRCARAR
jgi:NADH-quinone oxidoreductase subunit L